MRFAFFVAFACVSTAAHSADLPSTSPPPPPQPAATAEDFAGWSAGAVFGTLGPGGELGYRVNNYFGLRGQANWAPLAFGFNTSTTHYNTRLDYVSGAALADYYPWGGMLRVTGGLRIGNDAFQVSGTPLKPVTVTVSTPMGPVTQQIQPSQIGGLTANVHYSGYDPYLGVGLQTSPFSSWSNLAVGFDAGAMIISSPGVSLTAPNAQVPAIAQPAFQGWLAKEQSQVLDKAKKYHAYPVVEISLDWKF